MKLTGKVESVKLVRHISEHLDYCEMQIDFDRLHIFGYYNDLLNYIDKYVEYSTRQDMVDGVEVTVIASVVDQYPVQTLDRESNIKLLVGKDVVRPVCNFAVEDLKFGDTVYGAVCLLSSYEHGKSMRAKWIDCTMVDKNSKVFIVKIFATDTNGEESIEEVLDSLIGKYVEFDVVSTKYGFQTQNITLKNIPVLQAPEVLVAESILNTIIGQDTELMAYVKSYNLVENLKNTMRIDLGYELVYMAAELSLIESLENITDAYDFRAMKRAVFCMRGYLLQCKTRFSKSVRNFNKLSRTELRNDRELLLIIDPMDEEEVSLTKKAYYKVHKFAEELIDERRGLDDEAKKDGSTMSGSMRESFISML